MIYHYTMSEFEYDKSEFICLAFTIKKLKDPKNAKLSDYSEVLDHWLNLGVDLFEVQSEVDTADVLHVHGRLVVRKNFYKKRLQTFGYHVFIRDIFYEQGWKRYINKQQDNIDNKVYMF